ncbi:hypothetical protein F4803DRAFT_365599 [Xylaria telfairii]|nr:hypothetical protein F4803DRAFT_365599 [Xylaria telfairii]
MADSQYVAGKRQHRHRRQTAASETHDWEPRREESRHSMPYRTRQPEVQRSDRRKPKYSSHRSRASEDFLDTRSMPPVRLLTRPTTPKPRGRRVFDHDHDDDDDDDDDDNDDDSEKERLRGRLRSRSRSRPAWGLTSRATSRAKSRVKSRPTSRGSQSTDSTTIPTPTRSSFVNLCSAPSAPSLGASTGSSTDDSDDDSSDSTEDYQGKTRTLKERMNGTPDSEPITNPASRSRSRHKSRDRIVPEIESATDDSEEEEVVSLNPRVVVKRLSQSRHRKAHQSRSPSRAPRQQRRPGRRSEEDVTLPPKRAPKKYYHSDVSYHGKPSFSQSRATSTSRVTSHSLGSSSKQPSGNFFQTPALPQPYDTSSKM